MIKIMVLSDSHANNDWIKIALNYDYVIHAGDHLNSKEFMINHTDQFVDGNNDFGGIHERIFELANFKFLLVHGDEHNLGAYDQSSSFEKLLNAAKTKKVDVVIFGHTHLAIIKMIDNILFLNPGSIAKPRMLANKSYIEVIIENHKISANIIYLNF